MSGPKRFIVRTRARGVLFAALAVVLALVAVGSGSLLYKVHTSGIETSAVIVDDPTLSENATVEFKTLDGRTIRTEIPKADLGKSSGNTVRVRYLRDDPSVATGTSLFGIVMNSFMTAIAAMGSVSSGKAAHRRLRRGPPG
ncbi:hypothetical protein [Actinomadura bangladeshensis]|uniref:DUF3592 domain-containing protein n=1 Tax=Actinomadura bangladeshensis TaxID=453573 RepID=A0A4R4NRS5_9ACTN|nr:hypothetical protein [Actinomadura bangladeshensis]TDC11644.1 hypothetical protein E1284_27505 [Actinomadura bangladeshensis]